MDSATIEAVEECLVGVWSTTSEHNGRSYGRRLIFNGTRGFLEYGDPFPTLMSVEHFAYRVTAATVLEVSDCWQEYLSDDACSTLRDDQSSIEPGEYDIAFHSETSGLRLQVGFGGGLKTDEPITESYTPKWNFFGRRHSD